MPIVNSSHQISINQSLTFSQSSLRTSLTFMQISRELMEYIKLCSLMISTHNLCPPPPRAPVPKPVVLVRKQKKSMTKTSNYTSASRLPFMFPSCRPLGIYSSDWILILQRTFWNALPTQISYNLPPPALLLEALHVDFRRCMTIDKPGHYPDWSSRHILRGDRRNQIRTNAY